jgi:hypothetical protein
MIEAKRQLKVSLCHTSADIPAPEKKESVDAWLYKEKLCTHNKLQLTNCRAKWKLIYNFLIT